MKDKKNTVKKYLKWLVPLTLIACFTFYFLKEEDFGSAHFNPADFKRYDLIVGEAQLKKMDSIAQNAISKYDFTQTKKWMHAKIIEGTDTILGSIRLKGDKIDHYDSPMLSFRLKYRAGDQKRVISLQHPKTRRYISEWIFHQMLKYENLPYLNFTFASVYINGKFKGLYAAEEHFSNSEIEKKWNRPHGPIMRFDDKYYWPEGLNNFTREFDTKSYKEAKIKCFNFNKTERKRRYYMQISMLLKSYQYGTSEANEVFDMDLMAKYYALVDLIGGPHSLRWLNCRFYFNPTSGRFEPVGFDSDTKRSNTLVSKDQSLNPAHHGKIFNDPTFKVSYKKYLNKYAQGSFLDAFYSTRKETLTKYVRAFKKEFNEDTGSQIRIPYINQWIILLNIVNIPLIISLIIGLIIVLIVCYKIIKSKNN